MTTFEREMLETELRACEATNVLRTDEAADTCDKRANEIRQTLGMWNSTQPWI